MAMTAYERYVKWRKNPKNRKRLTKYMRDRRNHFRSSIRRGRFLIKKLQRATDITNPKTSKSLQPHVPPHDTPHQFSYVSYRVLRLWRVDVLGSWAPYEWRPTARLDNFHRGFCSRIGIRYLDSLQEPRLNSPARVHHSEFPSPSVRLYGPLGSRFNPLATRRPR